MLRAVADWLERHFHPMPRDINAFLDAEIAREDRRPYSMEAWAPGEFLELRHHERVVVLPEQLDRLAFFIETPDETEA